MTLNELFDQAWCINLPKRGDRWRHAFRVFETLGWRVDRFGTFTCTDIKLKFVDGPHAALKLCHIAILSDALMLGRESVLIFEDDLLVSKDILTELPLFITELPSDWELCYLGWMDWLDHHGEPVSEHCQRVRSLNGAHAVGIRRSVMIDCIRSQAQMDCHCDSALARDIQSRGHAYAPRKNLVTQGCFGTDMLEHKPKILPPERLVEFV